MAAAPLDLDKVTALVEEAARTEVIPRFCMLESHEIREKSGPRDLVTVADLACETFLSNALVELLPGAAVVGEEAVSADPTRLDALQERGWAWIIDPVDGTNNFAQGRPEFAIMVALVHEGDLVAGWIHAPVAGKTVVAERGAGAFLNGERAAVAAPASLGEMSAALYVGQRRNPELHARVRQLRPRLGARTFARSAGIEYIALAEGRLHYALFTRQLPWDHAAGCLIHTEAGGHGAYVDRQPYVPVKQRKPLLLAPDESTWESLRQTFLG